MNASNRNEVVSSCRHTDESRMMVSSPKRGFTMIEMLVVIGVIAVLIAITFTVGRGVIQAQKRQQTESLMLNLNTMLDEYINEYGSIPPYTGDIRGSEEPTAYREAERYARGGVVRPEVAVFIAQVRGLEGANAALAAIPEEFLMPRDELYQRVEADGLFEFAGVVDQGDSRPTIADAWGMEVLYVHPDNDEATIGDGVANFDGYGRATGNRPYFMSAGPDLLYYEPTDVTTREAGVKDNVYSTQNLGSSGEG